MSQKTEEERAINLAIEILISEKRRRYGFNANLYKLGLITFRTTEDYKSYTRIEKTIEFLEKVKNEKLYEHR